MLKFIPKMKIAVTNHLFVFFNIKSGVKNMDKIQILVLTSGTIIIVLFVVYSYSGLTVITQKQEQT